MESKRSEFEIPPPPVRKPKFVDVDRLQNAHGLVSVITQHQDGRLTFGIFRLFKKISGDGGTVQEERTSFCPESLGREYIDLAELTLERITQLKAIPPGAKGCLPFPVVS